MKGFAMKASMSEMVLLGKKKNERVEVKIFLAGGCREEVLVINPSSPGTLHSALHFLNADFTRF